MATDKQKAPKAAGPATAGLKITSRSENGFRRCGRAFGPDGTVVPMSELTEDEVETLKAERQLVVVEVEIKAEKA